MTTRQSEPSSFIRLFRNLTERVSRLERRPRPDTVTPVGAPGSWPAVTGTAWAVIGQTVMWRRTDLIRAAVLANVPAGATLNVRARLQAAPADLGDPAKVPATTGPTLTLPAGGVAGTVGVDAPAAWDHSSAALVVFEASVQGAGTAQVTVARVDQR